MSTTEATKTITITVPLEQAERLQNALYAALHAMGPFDNDPSEHREYDRKCRAAVESVMRQIAPHV